MKSKSILQGYGLFLLTVGSLILLSPKWLFPPAAWAAPFLLISLVSTLKPWKAYAVAVLTLFCASLVSQFKVMPFPGVFFPIMALFISLQSAIPYLLNRVLFGRIKGWTKTLVFPCSLVAYEYITSFGGGGSWSSLAYTQVPNSFIIQSASLGGIWVITFAIGWFASSLFYLIEERFNWMLVRTPAIVFTCLMLVMTLYGMLKSNQFFYSKQNTVRVAGIANNQIPLLQAMYEDTFGEKIIVNEHELTQNSPELAELNKGFAAFIEDPYHIRFERTRAKLSEMRDGLFDLSAKEARSGSRIISWSEAAVFVVKGEEQALFEEGQNFASSNKIYFLMTAASIIPGKVEFGRKFIENKAILFGPDGNVLNVFFKNRPVPMIEPSIAGNGVVPVIGTPYGKLAVSICYDADFPQLMRQLGSSDADILLLPSGDWKEVSPYHAQMAIVRAIENGTSLLRPVSGAVSIATDFNGKVLAQRNYFDEGDKVVVGYLPVEGVKTIYTMVGDIVAWMCLAGLVVLVIVVAWDVAKRSVPIISTR